MGGDHFCGEEDVGEVVARCGQNVGVGVGGGVPGGEVGCGDEVTVVAEVANVPVVGMADSGELTAGEDLHAVGVDDVAGGEVLVVAEFAGAEVWQGKEITGG